MHVINEHDFVNLNGTHKAGRTDGDVTNVIFNHGRMEVAIPEIVYHRFRNLRSVFVTGNLQVRRFLIHPCANLQFFSFEGPANAVTRLMAGMFRGCRILQEIRIQRTVVSSIDVGIFNDTPNLRRLVIPRNQITSLTSGLFNNLPLLEHLDIERNAIVSFEPQIFQGLNNLRHIQCGQLQNRIWPGGLFRNLPNLRSINVNWSGLQTIMPGALQSLPSLETIRIYGELRRLSTHFFAAPLPSVHTLDVGTNFIEAIERGFFTNFPGLRNFRASRNLCVSENFLDILNIQPVLEALEPCFSRY
jgi:Leucine rich repeat/BspA type Leucine rich repeat region (6 copies)